MNAPRHPMRERYPDLGTGPVSTAQCTSREWFEREREEIFRHQWWSLLRREEELPEPGDYLVRDIAVLGLSVVVVRGTDGMLRAFHNACPHRGNYLVRTERGRCKGFQCDFHGWTYDPNGALRHVPDEEQFYDIDKTALGLRQVHLDTWRGFIYVNFDETPRQSLTDTMGDFNADLAPYPFEQMACAGRYRYRVNANWKVTMNAFQEGYHVAFVHKRSAPDAFTGSDNPYCHIPYIKLQENGNQHLAVPGNPSHTPSPTEALAFKFGSTFTQGVSGRGAYPGTSQGRADNWGFDLNIVFPFSRINVGAGWYYLDAFWPIAQDRTVYELAYYFPRPRTAAEMISQEFSKIVLRDLSREDLHTNEVTHRALMSGAIRAFQLSDQEVAVRHLYKTLERRLGA
jgi:phenylpropionate dioxygenase-like ring-hydroxylating dioxygenase large terminal subunit